MKKEEKEKKDGISELVDQRVHDILEADVEQMDDSVFMKKLNQAKIGMVYVRDREIMKRVTAGHMIRVINLISTNPEEKEQYIKATMPEIAIVKQLKE